MPLEKLARLHGALAVLLGANFAQTRRHLISGRFQFALCRRAATKSEHSKFFAHEIERLPQRTRMRIWPEVARAIILFESRQPEARPFLRQVDLNKEKPFIVTERNVVTWPVFLDQFAFEQERLRIAAHRVRLKIPHGVEHGARLQIGLGDFRWEKV